MVDLGVKEDANAGVLPARAVLLANLLTSSPLKDETAKRAHVPTHRLIAIADTPTDGAPVDNSLTTGASVKITDPDANVLTAHTDEALPLITVNTQAPDLGPRPGWPNAAFDVLESQLSDLLASGTVPSDRRIVLKRLGEARSGVQQRGPSTVMAVAIVIFVFLFEVGTLLGVTAIHRNWRRAATLQELDFDAYPINGVKPKTRTNGSSGPATADDPNWAATWDTPR